MSSVCHTSLLDRFAAAQCAESRVGGTADGSSDLWACLGRLHLIGIADRKVPIHLGRMLVRRPCYQNCVWWDKSGARCCGAAVGPSCANRNQCLGFWLRAGVPDVLLQRLSWFVQNGRLALGAGTETCGRVATRFNLAFLFVQLGPLCLEVIHNALSDSMSEV